MRASHQAHAHVTHPPTTSILAEQQTHLLHDVKKEKNPKKTHLLHDVKKDEEEQREFMAKVGVIAKSEKVEEGGKSVTYVVLKAETIDKYGLKPRE